MAAPDTPAETFKRALSHAARALAEQPELEVLFGTDGPRLANGVLTLPHPPRDPSAPESASLRGQADRLALRLAETRESLQLLPLLLDALPDGEIAIPLPARAGEGVGVVEGARGEVLHWLSLDGEGLVRACFARDPAWLHWPLLEAVMEGSELADLALCEHSFGLTCSGVDL